ncbi:separin [[Candida] anglica]
MLDGSKISFLDRIFTSFLSPLQEVHINTNRTIVTGKSPKQSVEGYASALVNSRDVEIPSTDESVLKLISKAFRCLYKLYIPSSESSKVIKRHQCYIIKLMESKNYTQSQSELSILSHALVSLVSNKSFNPESVELVTIQDIPYKEPINSNDTNNDQIMKIVIAYNFLHLQFLLQRLSSQLRVVQRHELVIIEFISQSLLSTSHLSKWLDIAYMRDSTSKKKHIANLNRIASGLYKINAYCIKKAGKQHSLKFSEIELSIQFKLLEYSHELGTPNQMGQEILTKTILPPIAYPFYNDLKCYTNKISTAPHDLMEKIVTQFEANRHYSTQELAELNKQVIRSSNGECFVKLTTFVLLSTSMSDLLHDETFLTSLKILVSRNNIEITDLTISSTRATVIFLTKNFKTLDTLNKEHLRILDNVTIFLQHLLKQPKGIISSYYSFIKDTLAELFHMLAHFLQIKRIRNLSNLYFNLGNNVKERQEFSIESWSQSIEYEEFVLVNDSVENKFFNHNIFQAKVEKVVNSLYELNEFDASSTILLSFLNTTDKFCMNPNETLQEFMESLNNFRMPLIVQLLVKCLVSNSNIALLVFGDNSVISDTFKCFLYIKTIELLEKSTSVWQKSDLVNFVTTNLRLMAGTKRLLCIYHYYNLNGLADYIGTLEETCDEMTNGFDALILSGIYLERASIQWEDDYLRKSLSYYETWLNDETFDKSTTASEAYEIDIVKGLVTYMKHSRLYVQASHFLGIFYLRRMKNCKSTNKHFKLHCLNMELELSDTYVILGLYDDAKSMLESAGMVIKSLDMQKVCLREIISWKLQQLDYSLEIDTAELEARYNKLLVFMRSRPELTLQDTTSSYNDRLMNLIQVVKFRVLSGKMLVKFKNYPEAYLNFRMAIKLSHSLLKRVGNNTSRQMYLMLKWTCATLLIDCYWGSIESLIYMGVTHELTYYLREFEKLDSKISQPLLNAINKYKLANIYVLLENNTKVTELLIEAGVSQSKTSLRTKEIIALEFYSQLFKTRKWELTDTKRNVETQEFDINDLDFSTSSECLFQFDDTISKLVSASKTRFMDIPVQYKINNLFIHTLSDTLSNFDDLSSKFGSDLRLSILLRICRYQHLITNGTQSLCHSVMFKVIGSLLKIPALFEGSIPVRKNTIIRESETNYLDSLITCDKFLTDLSSSHMVHNLSNHENRGLSELLTYCNLQLHAISKVDSRIITSDVVSSNYLYGLQDIPRSLPIQSIRQIYNDVNCGEKNELIPAVPEFSPNVTRNKDFSQTMILDLQEYLPSNWTVVCIDLCPLSQDIIITKYHRFSKSPSYLQLKLDRWHNQGIESTFKFDACVQELEDIIKSSNASTKRETTSRMNTKELRREWWRVRFELDARLKILLQKIENSWFGGFKGTFENITGNEELSKSLQCDLQLLLMEIFPEKNIHSLEVDEELLNYIVGVGNSEDILEIGGSSSILDDLLFHILSSFNTTSTRSLKREMEMIRDRFARIAEKYRAEYESLWQSSTDEHIVLIPGNRCELLPWESLSFLRNKSVSRMPSVSLLLELLKRENNKTDISVFDDNSNLFYLINPEGDLKRTESNFGTSFSSINRHWKGIVGNSPTQDDKLLSKILNSNLFVYLGHGGCEQYISTSEMLKETSTSRYLPPSLLLGCSSGALNTAGVLDSNGNVYNWLSGGSPMILVNLWDVTDKDIDAFSLSLFQSWGLFDNQNDSQPVVNICKAASQSRDSCTLKYLNGSAPIVYGLPLSIRNRT